MSKFNNDKFPKVGAMILKKEKDDFGKNAYYISIDKDTEVTVNGKKVTALNLQRPVEKFHRMLEKGVISEKEFDEKVERYEEGGDLSFIAFEISADLRDKEKKR